MIARRDGRPLQPRRRLALRLGLAVALGATLILVAAGIWNVALQREHMTRLIGMTATGQIRSAYSAYISAWSVLSARQPIRRRSSSSSIGRKSPRPP